MNTECDRANPDPAPALKDRLRQDLKLASANRQKNEAMALRALIAAIDNAEAPPVATGPLADPGKHDFFPRSTEIERLRLDEDDLKRILLTEIAEREAAASEMERLGRMDRALLLRAEAALAKRYVGAKPNTSGLDS